VQNSPAPCAGGQTIQSGGEAGRAPAADFEQPGPRFPLDRPNPYYRKVRTAPRVTRIFIGTGLVIGGLFGFLPVLGVWMIPLGLVVMFFDLPWVIPSLDDNHPSHRGLLLAR
jgi:hypothetical protein